MTQSATVCLSIVIPVYNEEATLETCVERVLKITREDLALEIILVDDCSRDQSWQIAQGLAKKYSQIKLLQHKVNQGKGAALRTGFAGATGDYVAVQDADLEYDPQELVKLLEPLKSGQADVVLGSRYLSGGTHRARFFWHTMMNKLLTLLSNMFTDLYLTDMETCYKVFKREVIQAITIEENRFGFEPEIVAKIAQENLRVYEVAISYEGRSFEEGKKIGWKDGVAALYCIFHYNAPYAPFPMQLLIYFFIGSLAALFNLACFGYLVDQMPLAVALGTSYFLAGMLNYWLCIKLLFRHKARWNGSVEILLYLLVVAIGGLGDIALTSGVIGLGLGPLLAKASTSWVLFALNFVMRKWIIFPTKKRPVF
ncbi:MAG: glycosyl transferase [Candidatus Lambdaproteobacteria bacterium RIFOXYD12_FULL_49_8]|uniref:Glycosyl transferase n=1 Tax=Candidatus Lambdaproteobacteria bacterium RIFOXYD2_FULL_50_16 TaxID=1817772 RepID=A0A1F6G829_9PROT|nr:MAG: glycosyl transferase [Candidatus Lambdaproteobacteria bacterium RIFOXYD2_FULL_50_16]OGG97430.1 MAG: glycosyl transferase [Candidatus Lambdaproteobacteria bacterium RIFOXYD12_FULL_49_8]